MKPSCRAKIQLIVALAAMILCNDGGNCEAETEQSWLGLMVSCDKLLRVRFGKITSPCKLT